MKFIYSKQFTIFAALILATLLLGFLHSKGMLKPVTSTLAEVPRPFIYIFRGIGDSAQSFFGYFGDVKNVTRKNAQLVEQIRKLQQDNVLLQQYKLENEMLKKELGYRQQSQHELIPANVIAKDPTGFSASITINAGTNQGIRLGQAVLSQGVLVGKIIEADSFTSRVLLVTDPTSSVDGQLSSTGEKGILKGSYGIGIVFDLLSQSAKLEKGQEVVTAGLTNQFPRGLLVGTVGDVQSTQNDLNQAVAVIPAVDISDLIFVSVIKNSGQ